MRVRIRQVLRKPRQVVATALAAMLLLAGLGAVPAHAASTQVAATHATVVANLSEACLTGDQPAGTVMPAPFLKLPFRAADAVGTHKIWNSQGWFTSPDELAIDDEVNGDLHGANDLELLGPDYGYGKPVLAMADGVAYYSYQYIAGTYTDPAGVTHQVGWGGGLFVEIRHARTVPGNAGWVTQYIHLSDVSAKLHSKGNKYYLPPVAVDDPNDPAHPDWFPQPITQDDNVLYDKGVPVKQGEIIGYQGDSGIGFDWKDDFNVATGRITPRNRTLLKPGDPPQLHVQLYRGRIGGAKQNIVDPFGFFDQVCPGEFTVSQPWVNPYTPVPGLAKVAQATAFLTDRFGLPKYAG